MSQTVVPEGDVNPFKGGVSDDGSFATRFLRLAAFVRHRNIKVTITADATTIDAKGCSVHLGAKGRDVRHDSSIDARAVRDVNSALWLMDVPMDIWDDLLPSLGTVLIKPEPEQSRTREVWLRRSSDNGSLFWWDLETDAVLTVPAFKQHLRDLTDRIWYSGIGPYPICDIGYCLD